MMIKKAIAIAVGLGVCAFTVGLCCLCWGLWKLRRRMSTGQISATPEETPVENRKGLKKDVVLTFPTMKTSDLKVGGGAQLQCRICLLEFRDEDGVRQLPQCNHVFHKHCIDPVLDKWRTCPICSRRVLIDGLQTSTNPNGNNPHLQQVPLRTIYSDGLSSPNSPKEPSWILVNQPVPLPRVTSPSSSERFEIQLSPSDSLGKGEVPLLNHQPGSHVQNWNDADLERCIDISFTFSGDIPVEKRQQICGLTSTNEKGVDSFSFGIPGADAFTFPGLGGGFESNSDGAFRSSLRRSRGKDSSSSFSDFIPSTRYSRSTSRSSRTTNSSSDSSFKQIASSWANGHS